MRIGRDRNTSGIALVITLIILVLLAGMAVALLQTASFERGSSSSIAAKTKSDLAAQAAVDAAIASLVDAITLYPDSATSWETINGNDGTVLYYQDKTPEDAINSGKAAQTFVFPLASGGTVQKIAAKGNSIPTLTDTGATANAFNLNHARSSGDTQGWIGSSPQYLSTGTPTTPQPFRGQWIDLTENKGAAPSITGRYAYWMEDESFKANANFMTNTPRGQGLGKSPLEIPFQGVLAATIGGSGNDAIANSIVNYRNFFPNQLFFNYRDINQVNGQPTLADTMKFEATILSGGLNLSRNGSKRVNLNAIVLTSTDPTAMRTQLDQIIKPIQQDLPNFAQRFYRTGTDKNSLDVTDAPSVSNPSHRTVYLNKLAANIRDYIDTDSQPTVVNNDSNFSVNIGTPPIHPFQAIGGGTSGNNEVIAIGKERVPMMQEYALRVRQIVFSNRLGTSADYKISIDHYMEYWNMSDKDIALADLGKDPYIEIANQPSWDAGTLTDIPESPSRDIKMFLKDAKTTGASGGQSLTVFPAGKCTVITTDPLPLAALTPNLAQVYYIPIPDNGTTGLRTYSGKTDRKSGSNLRLNLVTRTTTQTDYETEITMGNADGTLESDFGGGIISSIISINIDDAQNKFDDTKFHFRGGSLRGNTGTNPLATTGDPRTTAEQIRVELNGAAASNDKTRYFQSSLNDNSVPGTSSLTAPNSNFVVPANWPDYSSSAQDANSAPMVIANLPLVSIGQLGDIFDPARVKGDSGQIIYSRGGGRTLRIGQPDDLWDGNSTSASREWTAWRLLDLFTTDDAKQLNGLININGMNRDNGAAFKTALYGYQFLTSPDGDPSINGQALSSTQIDALVTQMTDRVNNKNAFTNTVGPFAERGELSEMPVFNSGSNLSGTDMAKVFDRGREELFRRLAQFITTRGNVFTVYAVGQALIQPGAGAQPVVNSTSQLKVTFRLDPIWTTDPQKDPNWNPSTPGDVTTRLAKPTRYVAHILYAGD